MEEIRSKETTKKSAVEEDVKAEAEKEKTDKLTKVNSELTSINAKLKNSKDIDKVQQILESKKYLECKTNFEKILLLKDLIVFNDSSQLSPDSEYYKYAKASLETINPKI
jgi:ribosomal protein L11 methylase PrmA